MALVRTKMLTLSLGVYFKFIGGYIGIKTERCHRESTFKGKWSS